jgi:hypothetical protein
MILESNLLKVSGMQIGLGLSLPGSNNPIAEPQKNDVGKNYALNIATKKSNRTARNGLLVATNFFKASTDQPDGPGEEPDFNILISFSKNSKVKLERISFSFVFVDSGWMIVFGLSVL